MVCFNCGVKGYIRAKCTKDKIGWDKDPDAEKLSEEECRMRNKELSRQAVEIYKELRDKAKGIFNDANMDEDEDENFNGYTSNGDELANESSEQTMKDVGYTEQDKATNPTVKTLTSDNKPGSKRELSGSSDDDTIKTRRQHIKPEPNVSKPRNRKVGKTEKAQKTENSNPKQDTGTFIMAIVRGWFIFLLALIMFILVSINAQGLRSADQRRAAFSFFKCKHFDVILVQETHWTNDIRQDIECDWGGEVVMSCGDNHSRAVAILFRPHLHYTTDHRHTDNNGHIVTTIITITRRQLI